MDSSVDVLTVLNQWLNHYVSAGKSLHQDDIFRLDTTRMILICNQVWAKPINTDVVTNGTMVKADHTSPGDKGPDLA